MMSVNKMCVELRKCYKCNLKQSCFGCPTNGLKLDVIQYLKDSEKCIDAEKIRKQRLLEKLNNEEYITDSDVGISNNKQKSRLDNVPLDTPVYLIDANHNLYTGTIISTDRGLQRGKCFYGDSDTFYRSAIVDWSYL